MKPAWPELSFAAAKPTYETLHLMTQIVGKIRLGNTPWINHSWHVTLYVTPSGLTTSTMRAEEKYFQIEFDFLQHQLQIKTSAGEARHFDLENLSVAGCYTHVLATLRELGIPADIHPIPNELEDPIPFPEDDRHATYDPDQAAALHQALLQAQAVFTQFRAEFQGKASPVHFFWGSFDLAVSRFSGRPAPPHPGGVPNLPDWVAQEAYSQEVCSCGFWPGNEAFPAAAFYTYIYPEPEGYPKAAIQPAEAYYHPEMREFLLPYEAVQRAQDPTAMLLDFLRSTYAAAADLAQWDREALEQTRFSRSRQADRRAYKQAKKEK